MRVLVTGCASCLAKTLLPTLCAHPQIDRVIGIDIKTPDFLHPRFQAICMDMRATEIASQFAGIDTVVHLAFVVMQGTLKKNRHNRTLMRNINIDGSKQIFNCAIQAGVKHFVHLSSAAIYAMPNDSSKISENHRQAPLPNFAYAEDKIALEAWLKTLEMQNPDVRLVRLRPHVILGAHAQPFIKALLRLPIYPQLPPPLPMTQVVHEEDVVQAIMLALFSKVRGPFNLASTEPFTFYDLQKITHRVLLPMPLSWLKRLAELNWHYFGFGPHPAWIEGLRYSLVLDTQRAITELSWNPRHRHINTYVNLR